MRCLRVAAIILMLTLVGVGLSLQGIVALTSRVWLILAVEPRSIELGVSHFGEDLEKQGATSIRIGTNSPTGWAVYIRTDNPDLGWGKPITDFYWRSHCLINNIACGRPTWTPLAHYDQEVASDSKPTRSGLQEIIMDYKVDVKPTDPPGAYSLNLIYTAMTR